MTFDQEVQHSPNTLQVASAVSFVPWRGSPTPFCSLFIRKSEPPGLWARPGYLAFSLASSAFTGLAFFSGPSWGEDKHQASGRAGPARVRRPETGAKAQTPARPACFPSAAGLHRLVFPLSAVRTKAEELDNTSGRRASR